MAGIGLIAGNMPALGGGDDDDAKLLEGIQGEVHIAFRLQLGGEHNVAVTVQKGQGIEQAGDKLAGHIPAEGILSRSQGAPNREQIPLQVIFDALLLKNLKIRGLGPLHQSAMAPKGHVAGEGQCDGNQKTKGGAGFAAVQYLTGRGEISGVSCDLQGGVV